MDIRKSIELNDNENKRIEMREKPLKKCLSGTPQFRMHELESEEIENQYSKLLSHKTKNETKQNTVNVT